MTGKTSVRFVEKNNNGIITGETDQVSSVQECVGKTTTYKSTGWCPVRDL